MAEGVKKEKGKFFKRLGYGLLGGTAFGLTTYTIGTMAQATGAGFPDNYGVLAGVIGFAIAVGIQYGKAMDE